MRALLGRRTIEENTCATPKAKLARHERGWVFQRGESQMLSNFWQEKNEWVHQSSEDVQRSCNHVAKRHDRQPFIRRPSKTMQHGGLYNFAAGYQSLPGRFWKTTTWKQDRQWMRLDVRDLAQNRSRATVGAVYDVYDRALEIGHLSNW